MPISVMWSLTVEWYGDRLAVDYEPRSIDRTQAMLDAAGLRDDFWNLAGSSET